MAGHVLRKAFRGLLVLVIVPCLLGAGPGPSEPAQDARALAARIDQLIQARWAAHGVTPAPRTEDAEFIRRVFLDLAGRIPSIIEVRDFLDDLRPDKRQIWIEQLLEA